jgi:hypothetical protein
METSQNRFDLEDQKGALNVATEASELALTDRFSSLLDDLKNLCPAMDLSYFVVISLSSKEKILKLIAELENLLKSKKEELDFEKAQALLVTLSKHYQGDELCEEDEEISLVLSL